MNQNEILQKIKSLNMGERIELGEKIDKRIMEKLLPEETGKHSTDELNKNLTSVVKLLLFRIRLLEQNQNRASKNSKNLETHGKPGSIKPRLEYIG